MAQMEGRLQDPALTAAVALQMLKEASVQLVPGARILGVAPARVGRDVVHRGELGADQRVRDDDHAFLGHAGADVVDHLEARREPLEPPQLALDLGDAGIVIVRGALRGGRRIEHLPGLRHAIGRILSQETVQQRRSAARHARDEDRPADVLGGDARIAAAVPLDAEAICQQADDVLPHRDASHQVQVGLGFQRVDQVLQGFEKRRVLAPFDSRPPTGRLDQATRVESQERPGGTLGHPRPQADRRPQRPPGPVRETRHVAG
jgi:hypothetical protein